MGIALWLNQTPILPMSIIDWATPLSMIAGRYGLRTLNVIKRSASLYRSSGSFVFQSHGRVRELQQGQAENVFEVGRINRPKLRFVRESAGGNSDIDFPSAGPIGFSVNFCR